MLWWGKKAPVKPQTPKDKSADLRAQALANARVAREAIGQETLEKIAAAVARRQRGETQGEGAATRAARAQIQDAEAERVAQGLLDMLKGRE